VEGEEVTRNEFALLFTGLVLIGLAWFILTVAWT
jgi:hypothetical protein